jgi:hypothetical protein
MYLLKEHLAAPEDLNNARVILVERNLEHLPVDEAD